VDVKSEEESRGRIQERHARRRLKRTCKKKVEDDAEE
jgi:hypothetical protein